MFIVNDLGVNEPFGPMALSAVLKLKGHETKLGVIQKEDVAQKIAEWKPDLLAYSMMSVDMAEMKRFNDSLRKKRKLPTILGGPHATLERSCADDPNIDAVCVGEGEDAMSDVVDNLASGRPLEGIPNIITSSKSPLKLRRLIEDFDRYPFMDRELVYSYPSMGKFGIKGIWTSRGCVFPCPYCFNNRQNEIFKEHGRIVRRRSVDSVIREMKDLVSRYRVAFIRIQDDVFVHRVDDWLKEFSRRWSKEVRIPFYCLLRAELVTDEMARILKEAGCFSICMSIEAADDDIRVGMMRRRVTKAKLENAFNIFKKYRMGVYTNTILALPFTTLDHDIASLDFSIKVKPELPNFSIFMPYPGTDLGDYCRKAGIYDPEKDYITYGMRNMSPLSCFSVKEKVAQYNLCQLAIMVVKFPRLRNLVLKHLIYWHPNKAFFFINYMFAVTAYGRKIFYFKHSIAEYVDLIKRSLKHYLFDYMKRGKTCRASSETAGRHAIPGSGLGEEQRTEGLKECIEAMSNYALYKADEKVAIGEGIF